jgi:hydrogenase nickel incorporation protein HypA/HybF
VHELSLAEAVVDIAARHAAGRPVRTVEVRVGALRQVVPAALTFAFDLLIDGTALQGAQLAIEEVPARGRCRGCANATTVRSFPLQCSACGGFDLEVIAGEELVVEALELEEMATVASEGMTHGG